MIELGQLEANGAEFTKRGIRIVAASVDSVSEAQKTQAEVPHLTVIADPERNLCSAFGVIHAGAGPEGKDIAGPTTFLIDHHGAIRWVFRPDRVLSRLTPSQLAAAVDEHLLKP